MLRHLFALAFLPSQEIPDAFDTLKLVMPQEANGVTQWFEETIYIERYVGIFEMVALLGQLLYFHQVYGQYIYDSMETGVPRTQNVAKAWYHRWNTLVGQSHAGIYTIIKELQKEQQNVNFQIECIVRGEQRPKKKSLIDREKRIMMIISDKENHSVMEYLRGIAHNLTL